MAEWKLTQEEWECMVDKLCDLHTEVMGSSKSPEKGLRLRLITIESTIKNTRRILWSIVAAVGTAVLEWVRTHKLFG